MIVRTSSGSEYVIDGRVVTLRKPGESPREFTLIALGEQRVKYTDGELLYTSSQVVSKTPA